MRLDPEVLQAAQSYQLGLPNLAAGRSGELMGRGTGSSLEFQEYRQYHPGDDVRHIDWGAYARSDSLMVRLFRDEVSPRTEILLDASRSMATGNGQKSRVARQLAALFIRLVGQLGSKAKLFVFNESGPTEPHSDNALDVLDSIPFDGSRSLSDVLENQTVAMRPQSIRIVISDFLFPHDPHRLVKNLASGAGATWVLQLLSQWESQPTASGGHRLHDVETGDELDLMINQAAIARYLERLTRLLQELQLASRRCHAIFTTLVADEGLAAICRQHLLPAGILRAN